MKLAMDVPLMKYFFQSHSPLNVVQTCSRLNSDLFSRSDPVLFLIVRNTAARFSSSLSHRTSRGVPMMKYASIPTVIVSPPRNRDIPLHWNHVSFYSSNASLDQLTAAILPGSFCTCNPIPYIQRPVMMFIPAFEVPQIKERSVCSFEV